MLDRLISAFMAVSLAFLVWLYARGRDQETLDNVPIAVQLTLAPGQGDHYDLEINGPSQVLVSFTGPPSRIRELRTSHQRGEVHVEITLAVPEDRQNDSRFLDTVRVEAADVPVPPGVTAVVVEGRNRIPVTIHRLVERRLRVRLDHPSEEDLAQIVIEPKTVLVRGPQEILDRARSIPTQPCSLPLDPATPQDQEVVSDRQVPLVEELEGRPIRATPGVVTVHFTLPPRQKIYQLTAVPVQFLCPANFALRPRFNDERAGKLNLRLLGPATEMAPVVTAYIDLTAGKFEPGLYADEPLRLQLPKDFQLAPDQAPPRSGAFQLGLAEPAGKGPDIVVEP